MHESPLRVVLLGPLLPPPHLFSLLARHDRRLMMQPTQEPKDSRATACDHLATKYARAVAPAKSSPSGG